VNCTRDDPEAVMHTRGAAASAPRARRVRMMARATVAPVLRAGAEVCVAHSGITRTAARLRVGDASQLHDDVSGHPSHAREKIPRYYAEIAL
jgi:hypothetical protein